MTSTAPRISRLRLPDEGELSRSGRRVRDAARKNGGHVPNWLRAFAVGGAHTDRLNDYLFPLLEPTGESTLTAQEREILATLVSVDNGCAYCHTLHVHELGEALDQVEVADVEQVERSIGQDGGHVSQPSRQDVFTSRPR